MSIRRTLALSAFSALFFAFPHDVQAQTACSQTLSVGANVAAAVAAAPNGATICLNSGNYGTVNLTSISRTGFVTLRSASGVGAVMSPKVSNSDFIRFESMTLNAALVNNCSLQIQFVNSTFQPNKPGLTFAAETCGSTVQQHYLVDNVTFHQVNTYVYDGRVNFRTVNGAQIRNSRLTGVGSDAADGVQIQGGTKNLTIGPGNVFADIRQGDCTAVNSTSHCDAIQHAGGSGSPITITGNHFYNVNFFIMMADGSAGIMIENNVFDGRAADNTNKITLKSTQNSSLRHNTIIDSQVVLGSKLEDPASNNVLVENNIFHDIGGLYASAFTASVGNGTTNFVNRYNLFSESGDASGANAIIGRPIYVGGLAPSTWSGWQLSAGSPGKNAANDGKDVGATSFGAPILTLHPGAPSDVRILR